MWAAAGGVALDIATGEIVTTGDAVLDFSKFINATITLDANVTLGDVDNPIPGRSGCIELLNDGTGGWTFAVGGIGYVTADGDDLTAIDTTAGALNLLFYHTLSNGEVFLALRALVS